MRYTPRSNESVTPNERPYQTKNTPAFNPITVSHEYHDGGIGRSSFCAAKIGTKPNRSCAKTPIVTM